MRCPMLEALNTCSRIVGPAVGLMLAQMGQIGAKRYALNVPNLRP